MKSLIVFFLLGMASHTYAQSSNVGRVQIGVNFSPDVCFRTLQNNDGSARSEFVIKQNNEREIPKFGYTAGANVCFNLSSFFSLETGIQYANKGYQTKYLPQDPNLIFPVPEPNMPDKIKFIYNFHYIDIPLKANFMLGTNRLRFLASVGLTVNTFISETVKTVSVYPDRRERSTNPSNYDYNRINLSPTVSFGVDYQINSNMNLRIEPTFRYGILKITDSPVTGYLYNGGLNIGYYYGL